MSSQDRFLSITLHAHLPYVVNHGTWPHGLEWLLEAAAETYLPLLAVLRRLQADGIQPRWNIDFSPVLLEQLVHPVFLKEFPEYLHRKVRFAEEDEAFFTQAGELHFVSLAQYWQRRYAEVLRDFHAIDGNIVDAFRGFQQAGMVDLLTCSATHGYNPLLGTDESVRAQMRLAVATHRRHFGSAPKGIWLPECGYRPAGYWQPPVQGEGDPARYSGFYRVGVEQAVEESGLRFFFVDAHLITASNRFASPYGNVGESGSSSGAFNSPQDVKLYQTYRVAGAGGAPESAVFARDPRTAFQVWSGDQGYPADAAYLDFHKKRWPGGHRYWRVTGAGVDLAEKVPYDPEQATNQAREHARHFVSLVEASLAEVVSITQPPILSAPFDAELFGHWWWEGILFLEEVARALSRQEDVVSPVTCADYLKLYPAVDEISLPEGSWGAGGDNRVWLNAKTDWTYKQLYTAEYQLREICTVGAWRDGAQGERIVKQMCRELLLMESSDWPFLITTGAARDYAERRFHEHADTFGRLLALWKHFEGTHVLNDQQKAELVVSEETDSLFPDVNPEFWVRGARA